MKEQKKIEENHMEQPSPWLLKNTHICYDGELPTNNDEEKKFLQHTKKHNNTKEAYTTTYLKLLILQ